MFTACRIIGASALLVFLPVPAAAQAPLSLSEAVEQARRQHPQIEAALAAQAAAGHRTEQAGKWANPHVLVYQENFPGTTPDIDQTLISVTQRIRIGGQLALAQDSSRALQDAATADVNMTVEQLGLAVQRTYTDLYRVQESLRALDEAQLTVGRLLQDLEARVSEGDASRFDLGRMRLARDLISADEARLRAEQEVGWQRLVFFTGRTLPDGGWVMENPIGSPYGPPRVDQSATPASGATTAAVGGEPTVTERFDAQALAHRLQATTVSAEALGKEAVPDLVATLGYTRLDPEFNGFVWSVGVDIPLFNTNGAAKAAELAEARRLEREYDALLAEAGAESRAAANEFARLDEALEGLQQAQSEELLPMATTAYEEGEITVTGLLDAARAQLDTRLRQLDLEWARADAWYRWRYASGQYVGRSGR